MNKELKQYKIISSILSAFTDGIEDALNVGQRNLRVDDYEPNWYYWYNQGYDFGITLYSQKK
jgi:hypothetical protein